MLLFMPRLTSRGYGCYTLILLFSLLYYRSEQPITNIIMERKTTFLAVCLCVSIFLFPCPLPALAESANIMTEYLVKIGKIYYDEGNFVSAIHEFTKAVMIDPNNEEAQYYLKKLGAEGGYFGRSEKRVIEINRLAGEIERYKKALAVLEKENRRKEKVARSLEADKEALRQVVSAKDTENENLRQEITRVQKDFKTQSEKDRLAIARIQKAATEKTRQIDRLNREMDRLNGRLAVVRDRIAVKAAENIGLQTRIKEVRQEAAAQSAKDEALLREMEVAFKTKTREIARLNMEMTKLNDRMAAVQKTISVKEAENIGLRDKVREIRLEARAQADRDGALIQKAQTTIKNKEQEIARLNTDLFELKDRLVAKMALLKEKESTLGATTRKAQGLERELLAKERSWQARTSGYQKEIGKLEEVFDRYKEFKSRSDEEYNAQIKKMHEVIRQNRLQLAFLNDRLVFTEYKLAGRDAAVQGNHKVIARLKNSLFALEKELAVFQGRNLEKGGDARKISRRIAREAEKDKLLKAKDQVIMKLKMNLARAKGEIRALGKSSEKLAALEESLEKIQREVAQQRSPSSEGAFDAAGLEAQIREIQQKIKVVEGLMRDKVDEVQDSEEAESQGISLLRL